MSTLRFRVRIVLRAVASMMVLWLVAAGFTKVSRERGSTSLESRKIRPKELDVAAKSKEKVAAFGSRPPIDVNFMSERGVSRGPDPIHNRRAGDSRRPPGQA